MKIIEDELKRVSLLIEKINGAIYLDRKYKDDLEWWVLGKTAELLKSSNEIFPKFADKLLPPEPDFITFDENGNKFNQIEVTEVINPNRKRSDECKKLFKIKLSNPDNKININLLNALQEQLNKKLLMKYEDNCWLLVYFNIFYSQISPYGYWHRLIISSVKNWFETKSCDISDCSYDKILVINSGGGAMVELYPKLNVIITEKL